MRRMAWLLGLILAAAFIAYPEAAASGAREGLARWYFAVAPALFPFMALLPLLTSPEAFSIYERLLGGIMRRLFGLPGRAAPALAVGLLAGSPAGCLAVARTSGEGVSRGALARMALALPGFSPGFLISGVGAAMLGSAALGRTLFISQLAAQLAMLLALRFYIKDETPAPARAPLHADDVPLAGSVSAILGVGGWMALFGAVGGVARAMAGARIEAGLLCALEVSSGLSSLSGFELPARLPLMSAVIGFGGLCAGLQNLSALGDAGISGWKYWLARLCAASLSALCTWAQLKIGALPPWPPRLSPLNIACLAVCCAALPILLGWIRAESLQTKMGRKAA